MLSAMLGEQQLEGEQLMLLRKLAKRDTTTKLKALGELKTAVGEHDRVPRGHRLPRLHSTRASAKHDAGSLIMRVPDIPGPGS